MRLLDTPLLDAVCTSVLSFDGFPWLEGFRGGLAVWSGDFSFCHQLFIVVSPLCVCQDDDLGCCTTAAKFASFCACFEGGNTEVIPGMV